MTEIVREQLLAIRGKKPCQVIRISELLSKKAIYNCMVCFQLKKCFHFKHKVFLSLFSLFLLLFDVWNAVKSAFRKHLKVVSHLDTVFSFGCLSLTNVSDLTQEHYLLHLYVKHHLHICIFKSTASLGCMR